jgi:hypothetical protein
MIKWIRKQTRMHVLRDWVHETGGRIQHWLGWFRKKSNTLVICLAIMRVIVHFIITCRI